ncbi:MAG: hypothetical protein QXF78_04380, partial [Pyrobaculum sp.]
LRFLACDAARVDFTSLAFNSLFEIRGFDVYYDAILNIHAFNPLFEIPAQAQMENAQAARSLSILFLRFWGLFL